jgi:hypothetical protein
MAETENDQSTPNTLNFDYIKGTQFRAVHADGAYAGLTGSGVTVSFYSERQAIPQRVVHKINPDHTLGDEIRERRVARDAIVREVDVCVVMSLDVLKALVTVLSNLTKAHDEIVATIPAVEKEKK